MTAATPAQRKAAQRAREKLAGLSEVRGILAPAALHGEVREAAGKALTRALKRRTPTGQKG